MDCKLLLLFITGLSLSTAGVYNRHESDHDVLFEDYYDHEDGYEKIPDPFDDRVNIPDPFSEKVTSEPEAKPRYEVTENVEDIPNPVPVQPIITNFTVSRPINLAKPNSRPAQADVNKVNENAQVFGFQPDDVTYTHEELIDTENIVRCIINGIKELGKKIFLSVNGPEIVSAPVDFLNKAQETARGLKKRVTDFIESDY